MHLARALVPSRVLFALALRFSLATSCAVAVGALAFAPSTAAATPPTGTNACGCYRNDSGVCFCEKKSKCGCEGECEPKGCEEKREKERQKELENEIKLAKQRGGSAQSDKAEDSSRGRSHSTDGPTHEERSSRAEPDGKGSKATRRELGTGGDDNATCPPCPCMDGQKNKKDKASKANKAKGAE